MPAPDPTLSAWDYDLPDHAIARYPAQRRSASRLLCVDLAGGALEHRRFADLPQLLQPGDLLVVNNTRVMAARLRAHRQTGGAVELLLLEPGPGAIRALAKPARKLRRGETLSLVGGGRAHIDAPAVDGIVTVRLDDDPASVMASQGALPLPPYLHRQAEASDTERYQTVFAGELGAAAAPTAGLHFDQPMLDALDSGGVSLEQVTLHVGLGTFRPLREEDIAAGELHEERYRITARTAAAVADCKRRGGRVIAVGTTSFRALESAAIDDGLRVGEASTTLFVRPGYTPKVVDGLITNFHLPRSSLLMLVATFIGRQRLLDAYQAALAEGYRFYSYGDAMLLL